MNKDASPQPSVPLEELRRIVKLMKDNDLSYFQFEKDGFMVKLRRGPEQVFAAPGSFAPAPVAPAPVAATAAPTAPAKPEGKEITSPMVGTFYASSSPESKPFLKVGDTVSVGQTICIIEAMKVMNEIKAETSGVVTAIVAQDGTPVQFGATLFVLK